MTPSTIFRPASWQWQPTRTFHPGGYPITLETPRTFKGARASTTWGAGCDDGGGQTGGNVLARNVARIGVAANHLAGQGRLLWCQSIPLSESPTADTDPFWRLFFSERMPQGSERVWVALCLPQAYPTSAQDPAQFGRSPGGPFGAGGGFTDDTVATPDHLVEAVMVESDLDPGDRWREIDLLVRNKFRLVGLTVYERPRADRRLDANARDGAFSPASIGPGGVISERPLHTIRKMLQNSWRWGRGTYSGAVVGTDTDFRITGTTLTNIFDGTSTSRTASTPGVKVDALYGAQYGDDEADAFVAVCAKVTGGSDGQVKFISSAGNVTLTGIGTTETWVRTAMDTPLPLDATAPGTTGDTSDKVDILAAAGTAGQSIDVYTYVIIPVGRLT